MTNEKNLLKRGADKTVKNCIKEDERGRPRVKATDSCFPLINCPNAGHAN